MASHHTIPFPVWIKRAASWSIRWHLCFASSYGVWIKAFLCVCFILVFTLPTRKDWITSDFPSNSTGKESAKKKKKKRICLQGRRPPRWILVWEDPLEQGTATHSSILAWRIPWTGELGGLQSFKSLRIAKSGHNWAQHLTQNSSLRAKRLAFSIWQIHKENISK